jgi:biopolymer transport protein ExbD
MNFRAKRKYDEPDVNILPLIDVVFLLLIFFMVTTTFERESEISITLPEASQETVTPEPETIEIAIDKNGRIFINEQALPDSQFMTIRDNLAEHLRDVDQIPVIINADAEATHQMVIRVMDAARQLGLRQITFATQLSQED